MLLRALWEMFRYDVLYGLRGLRGVRRRMGAQPQAGSAEGSMLVCRAVNCMSSFYWKPLFCLQRSVVTARLLRAYGIQADVVIGYRANPFMSHAWVEVDGRVVNDSPVYQERLQLLDRF
jgi:hypothetical protein